MVTRSIGVPAAALSAQAAASTARVVQALSGLDEPGLLAPSHLEGWSRLTIACHLRYGAEALLRLTQATLAGEPAAYYPEGRERQRPGTLHPRPGETPPEVVTAVAARSDELHAVWASLPEDAWELELTEPEGKRDLGPLPLAHLALLRLTEVEVHGSDLDLGLDDWSDTFVTAVLPFRLEWLNTRRANHRDFDDHLEGSWLLVARDGPTYHVAVAGAEVVSRPIDAAVPSATAVIEGRSRDLLALLLGRSPPVPLRVTGDAEFALAFGRAFPGP